MPKRDPEEYKQKRSQPRRSYIMEEQDKPSKTVCTCDRPNPLFDGELRMIRCLKCGHATRKVKPQMMHTSVFDPLR